MPKSVTKINKKGVTFISNVDQAQYTIKELSRGALRDVGKFLRKEFIKELKQIEGMEKGKKRIYSAIQYWNRTKEADLQIGFGNTKKNQSGDTWYGIQQELGTYGAGARKLKDGRIIPFSRRIPKRGLLRKTVYSNIPKIIEIESQYLSALNDMSKALNMAQEIEKYDEYSGDGPE